MIFEEDFVYVKNKESVALKNIKAGDEIFAYDKETKRHIWTPVTRIRKTGQKEIVMVIFKNSYHVRMSLDTQLFNKRDEFESLKDIAFGVNSKEGFNDVLTNNHEYTQVAEISKYGVCPTIWLEVENVDSNFYCQGVFVKSA